MSNKFHSAILTLALSVLGVLSASADNNTNTNNPSGNDASIYYIDAPRFVRPLIEKLIAEYQKVQPSAYFAIAKTASNRERSVLHVSLSDENAEAGQKTVYFAQYAILPVTIKDSEAAHLLASDELNDKKIKKIFFQGDEWEETDGKKNKRYESLVVYTGSGKQSVSQEFAAHYNQVASSFRGKRIVGDDQFLNSAIAKDPKGVTINTLANIYDLQTRHLKSTLTLLPLDVDKSLRAALDDGATLDDLLATLEASHADEIPVEAVGLSYAQKDAAVESFVDWVLAEGKAYNHEYGLLNLSKDFAQK